MERWPTNDPVCTFFRHELIKKMKSVLLIMAGLYYLSHMTNRKTEVVWGPDYITEDKGDKGKTKDYMLRGEGEEQQQEHCREWGMRIYGERHEVSPW